MELLLVGGYNSFNQSSVPGGLNNIESISAGHLHSMALKSDSTVVAWGYNLSGETDIPSGLKNVVSIVSGSNHSITLLANGTVVGWGARQSKVQNLSQILNNVFKVFSSSSSHYNFALHKKTNEFDRTPSANIMGIITTIPNCDGNLGQVEFTINDTTFYDSLSLRNTVTNEVATYCIKQNTLVVHNIKAEQPYEVTVFDIRKEFSPRIYSFRLNSNRPLKAISFVEPQNNELTLNLSGGTTYTITLNGNTWQTKDSNVNIPLVVGMNKLKITSDHSCNDSFEEHILIHEHLTLHPNPALSYTTLHIGGIDEKVSITIESDKGVIMSSNEYHLDFERDVHINLDGYKPGLYLIQVKGENISGLVKLLKQ